MKKGILIALASTLLIAPGAFASFSDVPEDHWASQAIQKLVDKGIISGFPGNKFLGSRNVTRYELAATLNKLLAEIEKIDLSSQTQEVKEMVEKLKKELKSEIEKMKSELREEASKIKAEASSIKEEILNSLSKVKVSGKVVSGLFVENIDVEKKNAQNETEQIKSLSVQPVINAKLHIEAPVYQEYLKAGLQLSTGAATPISSTAEIGTDLFGKKAISLDRAYINWNPSNNFELGMGKFSNPYRQTDLTSDWDTGFEGLYIKPKFDWFTMTAGVHPLKLNEKKGLMGILEKDNPGMWLGAAQLGFDFNVFKLDLGLFSYQNADKSLSKGINGDGMTLDDNGAPKYGFNVADVGLGLHFDLGAPVCIKANVLKNLGKDFNNFEFGMPSAGKDSDGNYKPGNTVAYMAGLKIGSLCKVGYEVGFDMGQIGSDATVGYFNASPPRLGGNMGDVQFGGLGTNVQYMKPYISIGIGPNVSLNGIVNLIQKLEDTNNTGKPNIISSYLNVSAKF